VLLADESAVYQTSPPGHRHGVRPASGSWWGSVPGR